MAGNGTLHAKMLTNDAPAIAQSQRFFKAFDPIRNAAKTTIAVTAGLIP